MYVNPGEAGQGYRYSLSLIKENYFSDTIKGMIQNVINESCPLWTQICINVVEIITYSGELLSRFSDQQLAEQDL